MELFLLPPVGGGCRRFHKDSLKYGLVKLPGAIFVGIKQGSVFRRRWNTEALQSCLAACEASADFARQCRPRQLVEKHGKELAATAKAMGMKSEFVIADRLLDLDPGKQF